MRKGARSKKKLQPRNIRNTFLIDFLQEIRLKAYSQRNEKKAFTYGKAIDSVQKYLLPIIHPAQLLSLSGFGPVITKECLGKIKQHYKNILSASQNCSQKMMKYFDAPLSQSSVSSKQSKGSKRYVLRDGRLQQIIQEDQVFFFKQEDISMKSVKSIQYLNQKKSKSQDVRYTQQQQQNQLSKSEVSKSTKIRNNSKSSKLLYCLAILSKFFEVISRDQAQKKLKQQFQIKLNAKQWKQIVEKLGKENYIFVDEQNLQSIILTQKGRNYKLEQDMKKQQVDLSKKACQLVQQFKYQSDLKDIQKAKQLQKLKQQEQIKYFNWNQCSNFCLMIDNRQIKNRNERLYFQQKLVKKYQLNTKIQVLALGDFLWTVNGYVTDYIVERKAADDLGSSIIDGRYKSQLERLDKSPLRKVFYIYEGHPSQNCVVSERALQTALIKISTYKKIIVLKTASASKTVDALKRIHDYILQQFQRNDEIIVHQLLKEFNLCNQKRKKVTTQTVFEKAIYAIPGLGNNSTHYISKYFKNFRTLYSTLKALGNQKQRKQFLAQFSKQHRIPKRFQELMPKLLFKN